MQRYWQLLGLVAIFVAAASLTYGLWRWRTHRLVVLPSPAAEMLTAETTPPATPTPTPTKQPLSLVFVGDIMLDRGVWSKMQTKGVDYPFLETSLLVQTADLAIGNLEGPISERGVHARPNGSLIFKFEPETVGPLVRAGFDYLSLANNHSLNQGTAGFEETESYLETEGIRAFGHPRLVSRETTEVVERNGWKLGFVGWNAIETPDLRVEELLATVSELDDRVDYVIVMPHWGNEYTGRTEAQQTMAHRIVEAGADLIIGAHAHVVQGAEVYQGAPIFYSLGNFIFDQYWSASTQQGLALRLTLAEAANQIELLPIDLRASQPKEASDELAATILKRLADDSPADLRGPVVDDRLIRF